MKLLLDTNALIDLVTPRPPYDQAIRKLVIASVFGDVQLWVSTQSYADAYYVLRKHSPEKTVKEALATTLDFFLPCGTYPADLVGALESDWPELEDYLIAYSSKHIKADYLITRDRGMTGRSPIPAMDADAFLTYLEQEHGLVYEDITF